MDRLALANVDKALEFDPSLGFAHAMRARVYFDSWSNRAALKEAAQALSLSPNDAGVLGAYAQIELMLGGGPEEAISYWERAIQLDPNFSGQHLNLGRTLQFAGRHAEARESIERCLTLDPTRNACTRELPLSEFALGEQITHWNYVTCL